jgi:hypothetical protein
VRLGSGKLIESSSLSPNTNKSTPYPCYPIRWNGKVLKLTYPQLFSFTLMENITLSSVLQHENLHDIFQLPLSEEAYMQYCEVSVLIQSVQDNTDNDKWK